MVKSKKKLFIKTGEDLKKYLKGKTFPISLALKMFVTSRDIEDEEYAGFTHISLSSMTEEERKVAIECLQFKLARNSYQLCMMIAMSLGIPLDEIDLESDPKVEWNEEDGSFEVHRNRPEWLHSLETSSIHFGEDPTNTHINIDPKEFGAAYDHIVKKAEDKYLSKEAKKYIKMVKLEESIEDILDGAISDYMIKGNMNIN